jgi:hypothetical protein
LPFGLRDLFPLERSGTVLRRFFSLFFLSPYLLGDSSSTWIGGGRSVGGERERNCSLLTTVPTLELSILGPSLGVLSTGSCEIFCAEPTGGWTISRMEGRGFEGETIVADCLLSRFLSLKRVGSDGLENMARFSLFRRRSFDDAGDVTRGRFP